DAKEARTWRNPSCGYVCSAPGGRGVSPGFDPGRELGPRAHAELRVDALEIRLDRVGTHEQRIGDLAVRLPLCNQAGHLLLGRRQRKRRWWASADPRELGLGEPCPDRCPELREDIESSLDGGASRSLLLRPALDPPTDE